MQFGISTACFYPETVEKSLEKAAKTGYKNIEIFFNTDSEYSDSFISEIKAFTEAHGIAVVSAHPYTSFAEPQYFFSDYQRRYDDGMEIYKHIFHQVAKLGVRIFQFHGAFLKQNVKISPERYAETYMELKKAAAKEGIIFSQENVGRCLCGKKDYIKSLVDILGDEISFTLDIKQAGRSGEDPEEIAKVMKNINMVHINDATETEDCLLPCCGSRNLLGIKKTLDTIGFSGVYMTEVYSKNYSDISDIIESKNKLEKLFSENCK